MIAETLYRGTSYHQLRVWTYPKTPTVELLLSSRIFNFPFVDDPLSALLMGAEQGEKDKSPIAIVIAKKVNSFEDKYPPNGTYKTGHHLDFGEIKPAQLEILIQGGNLNKLSEYCSFLTPEKIDELVKYTQQASKTMRTVPREIKDLYGGVILKWVGSEE